MSNLVKLNLPNVSDYVFVYMETSAIGYVYRIN